MTGTLSLFNRPGITNGEPLRCCRTARWELRDLRMFLSKLLEPERLSIRKSWGKAGGIRPPVSAFPPSPSQLSNSSRNTSARPSASLPNHAHDHDHDRIPHRV